jgi:hypothetical protein
VINVAYGGLGEASTPINATPRPATGCPAGSEWVYYQSPAVGQINLCVPNLPVVCEGDGGGFECPPGTPWFLAFGIGLGVGVLTHFFATR